MEQVSLNIPNHVAIIMDGNGRWAKARGLPRVAGHRKGAESVRNVIEKAVETGVKYVTLYSFSSENWNRPQDEVKQLMGLLKRYLNSEIAELHGNDIRFRVIGERHRLSSDLQKLINDAEELTKENSKLTLILALSYGSRQEIVTTVRNLARSVSLGLLEADAINESVIDAHLWTGDIPDPDLVIRTSGEKRISNFLLWQVAYSEFVFSDKYWPDFGKDEFQSAIEEYNKRERRYGRTAETS